MSTRAFLAAAVSHKGGDGPSGILYPEDYFSPVAFASATPSIKLQTGIDMAAGGLFFLRNRSAGNGLFYDTIRGTSFALVSNAADRQNNFAGLGSFDTDGVTTAGLTTGNKYGGAMFRRAPRFLDIIQYSGIGGAGQVLSHALECEAGFILVKAIATTSNWCAYHRSATGDLYLNNLAAETDTRTHITYADESTFIVSGEANVANVQYMAYVFAHDEDPNGIIQCGRIERGQVAPIGWEPQFLLLRPSGSSNWALADSLRGISNIPLAVGAQSTSYEKVLYLNANGAETTGEYCSLTADGFLNAYSAGSSMMYVAIRHPRKRPAEGREAFTPVAFTGTGAAATITIPTHRVDALIQKRRATSGSNTVLTLRQEYTSAHFMDTNAALGNTAAVFDLMTGYGLSGATGSGNVSGGTFIHYALKRAPGFFDTVDYGGDGVAGQLVSEVKHSLEVPPELILIGSSAGSVDWSIYHKDAADRVLVLNSTSTGVAGDMWGVHDDKLFRLGAQNPSADRTRHYAALLFATLPGVSKVGSYVGTGSVSQTIPVGVVPRFLLIKALDDAGDWFFWDTVRGMGPASDPRLSINTMAVEVTNSNAVHRQATPEFIVNPNEASNINVLGKKYIFLAIG